MKAYQIQAGAGLGGLERVERPSRDPGAYEIRVRVDAAALNHRDLSFARGQFYNPPSYPIVPLVDGCGDVIAVGEAVTRFKVGDRVITSYYPRWIDGALSPAKTAVSFGAQFDGTLAEELVASEEAFVLAPRSLDPIMAATLPCAGVTAWNALFVAGAVKPGGSVLLLGTGGVSLWALQLARAAGVFTIVTSSQDKKLERARSLGANATINYRNSPEWQDEVLQLTEGGGVDVVVEVGGEGTLARSLKAAGPGGTIVVIGRVSGGGGVSIEPGALVGGAKRLAGITAGSRAMLEQLVRFVDVNQINPAVDKVFPFDAAPSAYEYLAGGRHFGKVVVDVRA
ncbi:MULTISPECIES: zinc-dependent alcohol dehydrogenase family protein [Paraburkholderia]|uniref:zinc-dependent alcohol dehydrogenase family protein n=1 Tax=Paraburkholderia TaxID=1822464 RepID=UPI002254FE38|nr:MULTISPECIES: NAD(P)-dependent alcohol dehydrogenase [Paraburkholderia]MCX4176520.1 NAD(P)-dependent alcohol dehydrogenase [Paraburkholderia madseniana]MDQ6464512.1 NAD(P)-dependent alcohol dehydrogenase [Paraburkholderia madseniana]